MIAVANAGYRAIAIDFRGYGLSDQPAEPEKATFNDLVEDIVSLLDSLGINKVRSYLELTSLPGYILALMRDSEIKCKNS